MAGFNHLLSYIVTYFLAQFGIRIGKGTLVEMRCISSISVLNLVFSLLSWVFLAVVRRSYHAPVCPPVPVRARVIMALLQIIHFMFLSKSIAVNTYSVHQFALLLSIPFCLVISYFTGMKKLRLDAFVALAVFCLGSCFISSDAFAVSLQGLYFGLLYAIVNAQLSMFIEYAMNLSGSDPILFQEAIAGFRVVFSVALSAVTTVIDPTEQFEVQLRLFPVCLVIGCAALELTTTVSMCALIASSSALTFVVVGQFCELMMILIGHTLNPTRFTTMREAVMSFIGFALTLPAFTLFLAMDNFSNFKPSDVEPFQVVQPEVATSESE